MSCELNRMPGSFNSNYRLTDPTMNKDGNNISNNALILIIGQTEELMNIKRKLQVNGVKVILIDKLSEKKLMKHVFDISAIITCFNYVEMTMTIIKEDILLQTLFIPIIVYSDLNSSFSRKVSYLHGVDDYISSSIDIYEIIIRINRQIEKKQMLNSIVFVDELTNAYNRKYLRTIYLQLTYLSNSLSVVLIDIDRFKKINDQYGYIVGDEVLTVLVNEIKNNISEASVVVRLGGDEFLILSTLTSKTMINKKVRKILKKFSNIKFYHNNATFKCKFSAGILMVNPQQLNLSQVIKQAQSLLRVAKTSRNLDVYSR